MSRSRQLLVFRHLWGIEPSPSLEKNLALIGELKNLGYSGVEASLSAIREHGGAAFLEELKAHDMKLIVGIYSGWTDYVPSAWEAKSVADHLKQFEDEIQQAHALSLRPTMLNAHAGCDYWNERDCQEFLLAAEKIHSEIPIAHETHRGRMMWNPWRTLELIEKFPSLKLTLDFSHWCVGAERPLDTPWDHEWIKRILPRVIHIHGRVGTEESPQVIDPRDPNAKPFVERFDRIWADVWRTQAQSGAAISTLTPEYGPSPYTPMTPFTGQPLSDVWEVVNNECKRQQERFRNLT
ncbi:unnamed protein product [Aphanomyces euteiches]|uniref:Xylose isomerase-like TIM barrel domain-containing protein n=1 Tax=Aphanomyces euteiches TaxID=100861 RepID=A0A6G0WUQ8_9STRA|nr:hypothetical protein Ae201684_011493 [Aphanomyces euteiches]KAH9096944.1 hypothetical protein Ae201684P_011678 [Aphanomyces euteiches]KAH9154617.1 hypothetical protein AeRB84_003309 [Aphanomyces euteiches]